MSKRRITLSLDEDVVEALEAWGERSLSAAANTALREAVAKETHHRALLGWLDELDQQYGVPSADERAEAARLLDDLEHGDSTAFDAA